MPLTRRWTQAPGRALLAAAEALTPAAAIAPERAWLRAPGSVPPVLPAKDVAEGEGR